MQEERNYTKEGEPILRSAHAVKMAPGPGNRKYWRKKGLASKKEPTSVGLASDHNSGVTKVVDPYARLPRSQREAARQADLAKAQPKPKRTAKKKETTNE